jgi:hypothetical protein
VTIEFGPSPAFSQPNPGSPLGFHHTLRSPELCTRPRCLSSHSDLRRPSSLLIHPVSTPSSHSARLLCSALLCSSSQHDSQPTQFLRQQVQITAGQTWSDVRLEHQIRHPSTTTSTRYPRAQQHISSLAALPSENSFTRSVATSTPVTSNKRFRRVRRPARPPFVSFDHHGFPRPRSL